MKNRAENKRKNSFDPRTDVPAPLQSYTLPIEVMMDRIARCGSGISRLGQCVDGALNCLREAIIHCFSKLKDIYHQSLKDAHTQSLKCDFSSCFSQLKAAVSACQTQMLQGGVDEINAYFKGIISQIVETHIGQRMSLSQIELASSRVLFGQLKRLIEQLEEKVASLSEKVTFAEARYFARNACGDGCFFLPCVPGQ